MPVETARHAPPDFLPAGGEMAARIRAFDWSQTPLGAVDKWSAALRTTVSIVLSNGFPMLLWWGPEYISIYNDAYLPFSLLYVIDRAGDQARLAACSGVDEAHITHRVIDMTKDAAWPFVQAKDTEQMQIVEDLAPGFARLPPGRWPDPPSSAVVVPIRSHVTRSRACGGPHRPRPGGHGPDPSGMRRNPTGHL
jgi:hypothetical protein